MRQNHYNFLEKQSIRSDSSDDDHSQPSHEHNPVNNTEEEE